MRIIFVLLAATGVLCAPENRDDVGALGSTLDTSVQRIDDYRDNYLSEIQKHLSTLETGSMTTIVVKLHAVIDSVLKKLEEAEKNGMKAPSSVHNLGSDLNLVFLSVDKGSKDCVNSTLEFAAKFSPFLSHHGATGHGILEGLRSVTKNFDGISTGDVSKCFNVDWFRTIISNYEKSTEIFTQLGDFIRDFLKEISILCFQKMTSVSRDKLAAIGQLVLDDIADRGNHP